MAVDIEMECTGVNKVPNGTHFVIFQVADTPANRDLFGGSVPTGELRLQGIAHNQYTYEQRHVLTLRTAQESQQAVAQQGQQAYRDAGGGAGRVQGPFPGQPQQSQARSS